MDVKGRFGIGTATPYANVDMEGGALRLSQPLSSHSQGVAFYEFRSSGPTLSVGDATRRLLLLEKGGAGAQQAAHRRAVWFKPLWRLNQ